MALSSLFKHQVRKLFLARSQKEYIKSGCSIEIGDNDFILNESFSPHYNPSKDVVIRNYSSAVTAKNIEHLGLPFNELTQKRLFYTNFCGIIQQLPKRFLRSPYKIGDRVWGIKGHYKQPLGSFDESRKSISSLLGFKPNPYAHDNAWSEYLSIDMRYIAHLPSNIPLEYGGLFGTDLLMIFDGFGRRQWRHTKDQIEGKRVLIIGSGRQSLLNMLIPILQICGAKDISIITSHRRHNKLLTKFAVKSIMDRTGFVVESHNQKYDLIVDSLSISPKEIERNVKLIDDSPSGNTEYWVIRNPYHDVLMKSETRSDVAKEIFLWNKDIVRAGKRVGVHDVVVKPIRMVFGSGGLKAFAYWMEQMGQELQSKGHKRSYPIMVDRLYKLTNIEHAFEYCTDHAVEDKDYLLGEHIGLAINKVDQDSMVQSDGSSEKIQMWKACQLMDVDKFESDSSFPKALQK